MGIKETILGWLGQTPDKSDELRDAAIDEKSEEYGSYRGDMGAQSRGLGTPGEFESDQEGPDRH
jgi:hypothetical protein